MVCAWDLNLRLQMVGADDTTELWRLPINRGRLVVYMNEKDAGDGPFLKHCIKRR